MEEIKLEKGINEEKVEQISKLKNELSVSNSNKKLTESQLDSLKNEIATINAIFTPLCSSKYFLNFADLL